ncbi:MAG: D-alanine--D-alanine ligase, partial [Thiomargarita sp.]|nr:D-alanine--D-alanine ligase [Thiomargarita sp.]
MTKMGKIAVLMGGTSAERDISLKSGRAILNALQRQGIEATAIDSAHDVVTQLTQTHFDKIFIALHGRGGEDGTIQGVLEYLGLPYTGSGVLASALAMDKYRTKLLWQGLGLPTPPCTVLHEKSDWAAVIQTLGLPLMVKPALEGSSVGISKVTTRTELKEAWETAAQFNCIVIAEQYITGKEYTAAILHDTVLPLIQLETPHAFYDFSAKYASDTQTSYICPCNLPAEQEKALQALSLKAFLSVNATGWGRVDFMVDADNKAWLIEVNTIPGMTDHSLVPMAAKVSG